MFDGQKKYNMEMHKTFYKTLTNRIKNVKLACDRKEKKHT